MAEKRPKMRRPAAVADLLSAMLRGTPAEKRLKEGVIWLVWEGAVGKRIAAHAAPSYFRDGTLTVSVDSGPWLQQLSFLKQELIAKVNDRLGEELVTDLYLKAGNVPAPQPAAKPVKPSRELSCEERALIAEQTEAVADPELRAIFESLMGKAKSRG